MKIHINESEKNRILKLHEGVNDKIDIENDVIKEMVSMFKLMNIDNKISKTLFLESPLPSGGLKEIFEHIPVLKPLMKDLESEYIETLSKNLDELSETFASKGIKDLDTLLRIAREYSEINKGVFQETTDDAKVLIQRYLTHSGILSEVRKGLQNKAISRISQNTNVVLDKFKTSLEGLDTNLSNSPLENFHTAVDEMNAGSQTATDVKGTIDEIDRINKEIDSAIDDITGYRTELGPTPKKGTPEYESYTKYSRYIEELQKLKNGLSKQKQVLESVQESIELSNKLSSDIIFWKDKQYNVANMNAAQRALLKIGADHLGPLTYSIIRFIVNSRRFVSLRTQLVENVAKLKELTIQMKDKSSKELITEFSRYSTDTANLIEQLNGKYFNYTKDKEWTNVIREIIGGGKAENGYAEIGTIWKEIVGILKQEKELGNLTDAEAKSILDDILTKYSKVTKGDKVHVDDLNAFAGLIALRYDLESVGKMTGKELTTEFDKAVKDDVITDTRWLRNIFNKWYEAAAGVNKASFMKALTGVFLREFALGLPLNVRYYLKPIAKYGINLKSSFLVFCRLSAAKALSTIVFGGIGAWVKYLTIKSFWSQGKSEADLEQEAWASWNAEMEKYRTLDVGSIIREVLPEFDLSSEMEKNKITGREYIEKQNADFGIIDFNILSFIMELYSTSKAVPSGAEVAEYIKQEAQKAEQKIKTDTKEKLENYQNLYYTFSSEEQRKVSGENAKYNMIEGNSEIDPSTKSKALNRYFMKTVHVGETVLDVSNIQAIKDSYMSLDDYKGYACICKTNLKYETKEIKVGDETKIAKVPICDDYVRLVSFSPTNISDWGGYVKQYPEQPYTGKLGFIDSESIKDNSYKKWRIISDLKNVMK